MMIKPLDLSGIEQAQEPFQVDGKDYLAKAPSSEAWKLYQSRRLKGVKQVNGQLVRESAEDVPALKLYLVSLCTYNGDGKTVPLSTISSWDDRITTRLHAWLQQFIDEEEATEQSIKDEMIRLASLLKRIKHRRRAAKN